MNWLARQSLTRVLLIAMAWVVLLPVALSAAAELYIRWVGWRDVRAGRAAFYSIRLDFASPGGIIVLAVPPTALLVTWWMLRRGR